MIPDDLTILLIEDNPGDARLIEEHFREADIDVTRLDEGESAADTEDVVMHYRRQLGDIEGVFRDHEVDIVLLDLNLPGSHGTETVDYVRSHTRIAPIIVLTGAPEERYGIDAVSHGAQDYLVKDDVTPDVLLRSIRYAMERKKAERKLRRRSEELRILNQLTRHDIRNEMTLIVGRAQELEEHVDVHGQEQLDEIVRSSNHILQLTRTIGDIVTSVTSEESELGSVALEPVVESEIETARRLYGGVVLEVPDEIPEVKVRANDLFSSVLGNLLSNAVLYNDKETPEVAVTVAEDESTVTIRVADNGPGIPDRRKEQVFAKGEQGAESSGMGIGLYLVKRLVDQYGGDIWIEDNEPTGSIFCVQLQQAEES